MKKEHTRIIVFSCTIVLMVISIGEAHEPGRLPGQLVSALRAADEATPEQKETVRRILRLSQVIEQYIIDHGRAPVAISWDDLESMFGKYSNNLEDLFIDGWGNRLRYSSSTTDDKLYLIRSSGADGKKDPRPSMSGIAENPDMDIWYRRGQFVQPPPGTDYDGKPKSPEWSKQKETAIRIQSLGQAVELYILNQPEVGSPKTKDIFELVALLHKLEYLPDEEFARDGWGNAFIYEPDMAPGSRNYELRSLGSDGKRGS